VTNKGISAWYFLGDRRRNFGNVKLRLAQDFGVVYSIDDPFGIYFRGWISGLDIAVKKGSQLGL
jgi:hypothetical protein